MSRLDEIQKRYANTPAFGQGSTLTPAQMTYKATDPAVVEEQKKQNQSKGFARFGEGVGYFFEKVGLGALRGIEGIVDFTAGGIADLFGADAWAERQVANDWVNYDHADEWYQPRNGFERFMGDLGGGIGSTLPALAAVALGAAITYVTGGAGAGAGAAVAGAGTAGLSTAMSMLISGATTLYSSGGIALAEAYKETGELTGKEWGYAALSGGTEGAIEAISAGIGVGTGKLIKQFSKSGSKVVASGLKKTAIDLGKDFISEGAEEAAMEYIQPKFKQLTYDPNAKDATAQQIIYSGIVGGVSGMLMDGANVVVSKATDSVTGTLISKDQSKVDSVLAAAKSYADMEAKKPTKSEIIPEIAKQLEKYNALGDGAINNAKKTAILGSLSRLELLAETDKMAVGETMSILSNAESFAKTFKDGKYITPEGKEITVTKETLTNGIDLKDGKPTLDSIRKAIKNNFTLRAIVAARVSGEILANAGAMYTEVMEGNKTFQNDDEYRQFVEGLSDEQAESVMKQTGIDTMADNAATANAKLYYWKSEGNGKFIPKFNKAKNAEIRSKTLPQNPASVKVKKGELARYNDGFFDIVIEHNEDGTYNIFDINGGSGKLNATRKELNGYINSYRQAMVEVASAPTEMVEEVKKTREAKQTEESAERARLRKEATETVSRISERVEAYNGLSEPNKRAVREMARKAVSLGIKEDVILSSATYMANTGLNIQFVRPEAFDRPNVNALLKGDTIYINTGEVEISKAKTFDQLIIHETSHVLYRNAKVRKAIDKLAKRLTEEQRKQIEADYAEIVESKSKTEKQQIMDDEFGAHYLEYLLGKDGMLDALFSEEPTLRDKLEAHINKTEIAYKADHNLDRASKRVFKLFKKALADFSESNRGFNAYNVSGEGVERYALPVGNKIVDARSVTEQDVRTLLDNAFNKQYRDGSYIPVRVNTPSILIEAAQSLGKTIDDLPIILNVEKARQMMSSQKEWALEQKRGTAHDFTVDDVISLIKAMDKPKQIIYQSADERFVEIVEFDTAEKTKAVAVLEIGESKKSEYLNGYESGFYQVLVTAFEPDTGYVEALINKDGNIRIHPKKKKGASQSGSGNRVPSHLNESPFAISISQPAEKINPLGEKSSKKFSEPKISTEGGRASVSQNLDADYIAAVKKGDMVTAQRMVDEAAKKAGYSTEHLYHGTSMFGFTNIDVSSASDDSISFFATNRQEVASGYMPWYEDDASDLHHDGVRRIGVPDKSRPRGLSRSYSAERILTEAQKVFPEYKDARVATDDEVLADLKTYWLTETIEAAEKLRETELSIGSNKLRQQVRDMCDAVIAASKEDTLDAWKTVGNRYKEFDSIDIPYDATDMRPQIFRSRILGGLQQIGKFAKTTAIMLDGKLTSTAAIVDSYNSFLGGETLGMYDLYTKQGNQLVIQGRGSSWNQLPLGKFEVEYMEWLGEASEELSGKRVTTRDVAAFAKAKGYRSVVFYDIYDNGAYGSAADISDVYAFFHPNEDVKSADPVTYDDNGYIIPLSQRFNSANPDIRYSVTTPGGGATAAPSFVDPARRSATLQSSGYKPTFGESFKDGAVATKIAATNAQAGLERLMREVGYTREEAETDVQFARLARAQASNVIGVKFTDISGNADGYEVLGDSLVETLAPVMPSKFTKDGSTAEEQRYTDFQMLQYHMLNVDRMSLEAKAKKRYLPLDAVRQRLALESEGIKAKIDAIRGIRAKIEENKTQLAREKKKTFPDKDRITELTDRIAELEKNADKIIKGAIKRYTAKNVDTMFTMDEAMLKDIAKEAKLTEEEIKSLIGNAVAVLTAEDIDALNGLSSIADPIGMLKVVRRIIDRHASNLGTQINTLMQIKNKPVLGKTVVRKNIDPETKEETKVETVEPMTAEESRKLIKRYEDKYKSDEGFNKALKGVRTYLDNLMRLRIDTGLVSADMAASLGDMYPNYVPAHRLDPASGLMVLKGSRLVEVNKTVSTAKGSIKQIKPLHENLIEQTESTVRAARLNQLMSKLYERFEASNNTNKEKHFKVVEKKPLTKGDPVTADELYNVDYTSPEKAPRENQITFFYNGEKITVEVSKDVFVGFNDLAGRRGDGLLGGGNFFGARVLEGSMKAFRAVTTNYNPFFIIRNLLKDLGDALLLSDVPFYSFGANYVGAIKQMAKNSEAWRLYVASGGLGNTFFDSKLKLDLKTSQRGFHIDSATKNPLSWIKTIGSAVEVGNQFVEQIPRFAAFLAARKGGATVAEAMNAAAEITTNFQRGGTVTKTFNRSLIPFLNASVQGFVKIPRRLFNLHGKTWRETLEKLAVLLTNCVIVGIVPLVINALICGDQEGYDELRNTDKENYFLIPTGDGKFIKIPRGRVQASLASISNLVTGGSTVKETWGNVSSQVSPWGTMTRTIFSPIKDVSTNTTWYGGEIEGQQFEGIRPGARYDEGTSWIAKTIGGVLDYSPKKIDYLLGQYTGFFGDVILDATSQKANGNPLVTNFSVDSVTSNKLSTEFYKYYNEAQYAKNEGDDTALYQLKYLNKVKKEIRELYDQKSAIQTNSELSDKEKLEQTRVIQSYINGLYSAAIDNFSKVTDSAVATSGFGLEENERFREVIRQSFGAEAALEHWDEKLYESAKQMQTAGVSFEDYYDFYFSTSKIESDKDKNGNTVSGSKRAKVLEIVKAMDIPTEQKMLLFTSRGYSIKSRDFSNYSENTARNRLLKYILSLNVSKDEKARIAEMCGFKVKNGKIIRE